ncbi:MAG: hypothetical protein K0Q77_1348 [Anaerosporomusa subterranea]|jgi:hypothetical protein|nr:hypothetical protein [Anaerosporomusa subterranea]
MAFRGYGYYIQKTEFLYVLVALSVVSVVK